ncbi:TetR/AcrR family transcriptional regulator [Catellatospora chokoriensis]|uniref:TetR/AcrR family transcriptional regulator n=1 Tax=Catellatospora chokoriensis TaxID=310353 RepID=UPI001780F412|nr:TetR/AcrR family transcriptional regulator [Catellatospora chokoriensis]
MPKLWNATIDAHRNAVREAVLDAAAALVTERGLAAVTMSQIAESSGIGRATLYKYFPDVESILRAWHERQVGAHLAALEQVRASSAAPGAALSSVLHAYGFICHARHGGALAAMLHSDDGLAEAHRRLRDMVTELVAAAASAGEVRGDVPAAELADFCLHALEAARVLESKAAVARLVAVTTAALQPTT